MTRMKWITLALSPALGALLYTLAMSQISSALYWIDGLAYSSLLLFLCGGIMFIRNVRFFRAFWESCKRFYAVFRKREMYLREREGRQNNVFYREKELPHRPVLLVASGSFLLSLLLSVLYVY